MIDATATLGDDGSVTVFCVNRDMKEDFCLELDLRSFGDLRLEEHIMLHHDDVKAVNTEERPDNVVPVSVPVTEVDGGRASVCVGPLSWNVLRFEKRA